MERTCRLCGTCQHDMIDIFSEIAHRKHMLLKIRSRLDIAIFENDPLPKFACILCFGKLDFIWEFYKQCRETQKSLRETFLEPLLSNRNIPAVANITGVLVKSCNDPSTHCSFIKQEDNAEHCLEPHTSDIRGNGTPVCEVYSAEQGSTLRCDLSPLTDRIHIVTNTAIGNAIPDSDNTGMETLKSIQEEKSMPNKDVLIEKHNSHKMQVEKNTDECGKTVLESEETVWLDKFALLSSNNNKTSTKNGDIELTEKNMNSFDFTEKPDCSLAAQCDEYSEYVDHSNCSDHDCLDEMDTSVSATCLQQQKLGSKGLDLDDISYHSSLSDTDTQPVISSRISSGPNLNQTDNEKLDIQPIVTKACLTTDLLTSTTQDQTIETNTSPLQSFFSVKDNTCENNAHVTHPALLCNSTSVYKCEICCRVFSQRQDLLDHEMVHSKTSNFTNNVCEGELENNDDFQASDTSLNTDSHSQSVLNKCKICGRIYVKIKQHELRCSKVKDYLCELCGKRFVSIYDLQSHLTYHSIERPFSCGDCGKAFKTKRRLQKHTKEVHGVANFTVCEVCGKNVRTSNYKRHLICCKGETIVKCELCSKTFRHKHYLSLHLATHETECPFTCSHCGKAFKRKYTLVKHIKTHVVNKPFQCTVCDKSFSIRRLLDDHLLMHDGIRKYSCELCGKGFFHQGNLSTHMTFHKERTIECSICGKKYFRKNMLQFHMKNHHLE